MSKVSIIIPSRNEPYLQRTIDEVFLKSIGEIEVIVILDGDMTQIPSRDNLIVLYHSTPLGTRKSLNQAVNIANGKYIFKLDAHCMLSEGYDEILKEDHQEEWIVTLPRYSLNPDEWKCGYGPICYEYIAYPLNKKHGYKRIGGLTPKKWFGENGLSKSLSLPSYYWLERKKEHILIDEIQTCNAACWFLTKERYQYIGGLNENFWSFHIDGVEIGFKAWLSGGSLMVNKNAWHAHWFKSEPKRTVKLKWDAMRSTQAYSTWYWFNNKWEKQTRTFKWFIEHFWPIPGWPENWEEEMSKIKKMDLMITDA